MREKESFIFRKSKFDLATLNILGTGVAFFFMWVGYEIIAGIFLLALMLTQHIVYQHFNKY